MYSFSSPIFNRYSYRPWFKKMNHSSSVLAQHESVKNVLSSNAISTSPVQAKFRVGQANDPLEQEADRVADAVVSKKNNPDGLENHRNAPAIQRLCKDCEEEEVQLKHNYNTDQQHRNFAAGPPPLGQGQPMSDTMRSYFEPRFGVDFSNVRLHRDSETAQYANSINARAFTYANHIGFANNEYGTSESGKKLLAHELTHVIQQSHRQQTGDIQRDLARPPRPGRSRPLVELTEQQIQDAVAFNEGRFDDPYTYTFIRDVVGLPRYPAQSDEELVHAIVAWQAERGMTQDGKIGHITTRSLFLEIVAERIYRDAILLLLDSYSLPNSMRLNDVLVTAGPTACNVNGSPSDATVSGGRCPPRTGSRINLTVCRTSIPRSSANYTHFIRIIAHEMVHVIYCASGGAYDVHETEFDAFAWEACASSRAPNLSDAARVGHANTALAEYNLMPVASRTPERVAMRARLQALVVAGGAGTC